MKITLKEINIQITEEGEVTYSVGKKKTTFHLRECGAITYKFAKGKTVITEDMLSGREGVEPWLWLVISEGEKQLEYNINHRESRRHHSYLHQNDKFDTLMAEDDVLEHVLANLKKEAVREAIRTLSPRQQELVRDIYYRGLSLADVARRDGVSKRAITDRMQGIVKKLKKTLKNI